MKAIIRTKYGRPEVFQINARWGSGFIERTAAERHLEFPDISGFSKRNVYVVLQCYRFYSVKYQFVPRHGAQIPWSHNRIIINKIKDIDEAEFYCRAMAHNRSVYAALPCMSKTFTIFTPDIELRNDRYSIRY